jgi:hypothetical protein
MPNLWSEEIITNLACENILFIMTCENVRTGKVILVTGHGGQ